MLIEPEVCYEVKFVYRKHDQYFQSTAISVFDLMILNICYVLRWARR